MHHTRRSSSGPLNLPEPCFSIKIFSGFLPFRSTILFYCDLWIFLKSTFLCESNYVTPFNRLTNSDFEIGSWVAFIFYRYLWICCTHFCSSWLKLFYAENKFYSFKKASFFIRFFEQFYKWANNFKRKNFFAIFAHHL